MIAPAITILLEGNRRTYEPGDTLTAEFHVDSLTLLEAKAIEASVCWYTVGKGEEDLAVHHFTRITGDGMTPVDVRRPQQLRTVLPASPLSYEGVIVKVRWCVRVRLFPLRGRELLADVPFQLGRLPPVTPLPTAEAIP